MTVMEYLVRAVRAAAVFNPDVQVAPSCILWPDRDRQWESIIQILQTEMPELLVLGEYAPEKKTGPAIWLRCILAGVVEEISIPEEQTPILYLPGVSRQDLRAVESCPDQLKPLAELQYRGVIWSQINAKDWTILAFLKSDQGGLGLDVARDNDTKNAMQLALYRLIDEEMELLKGKHLDKDYFNTLLTGGDPVRDLLQWLDQGEAFKANRGENEWQAFVEVCKSQLAFNPGDEGVLTGAHKLAEKEGPWHMVWERYSEAPKRYPNIPEQMLKCNPPKDTLLWDMGGEEFHGWPQWNKDQEALLRRDLNALKDLTPHEARNRLIDLEKRHNQRRHLVWADLGEALLAQALEHLAVLAEMTANSLAAGSSEEMAAAYSHSGWRADDAVVQALAYVARNEDIEAMTSAICSVYTSWAEEAALHLQNAVEKAGFPEEAVDASENVSYKDGECVLFVDGLRFDLAKNLGESLSKKGFLLKERIHWAPLPTLTATGKPFVSPVRDCISGHDVDVDFEPRVTETGKSLKGGYHFKKLIADAGWKILKGVEGPDGGTHGWLESGNIDHEGHDRGWKLAGRLESLLMEIEEQVTGLLSAGWRTVRIVTDHGWLLLPGGLPKTELPSVLTENRWGRCAVLKPGASPAIRVFPWHWNPNQYVAVANGINCFKSGLKYTHGGLSLQESLLLELQVMPQSEKAAQSVRISDVVWRRLRCTIGVEGTFEGLSLDIRKQPGSPSSSLALSVKLLKKNGTASVVVEDDTLEGSSAFIILMDGDGQLAAQLETTIGGSEA